MIWLALVLLILGIAAITAAYKSRTSTLTNTGLAGINQFEDFMNSITGTAFTSSTGGAGDVLQGALTNRSTVVEFTNSTASSIATMKMGPNSFNMTTNEVLTLSTDHCLFGSGTPTSTFVFGCLNITSPVDLFSEGAYFMADLSVSNNWICVRNGTGSSTTQVVTDVPVDLVAGAGLEGSFHRLKIVSTNTRSLFYIDAVLVASITSIEWTQAIAVNIVTDLRTSASGAASITRAYVDYIQTIFQLATPRLTP